MDLIDGYAYWRRTATDGRIIEVVPLTLGRARIIIGDGHLFVDDGW